MSKREIPEFSRPVPLDGLEDGETTLKIEATEDECNALAHRFDLLSLHHLKATLRIMPEAGGAVIRIRGDLDAWVTQTCVVTLEPVEVRIELSFERTYGTALPRGPEAENSELLVGEDPPESIIDGTIDAGEACAEQLSLNLNPFPRFPGAIFEGYSSEGRKEDQDRGHAGPFAALARLAGKQD